MGEQEMTLGEVAADPVFNFDEPNKSAAGHFADPVRRSVTLVTDIAFWERSYGSHTRIRSLLRYLATHHDVTVFYLEPLNDAAQRGFEQLNLASAQIVSHQKYLGGDYQAPKRLRHWSFFKSSSNALVGSLMAYLEASPPEVVILEYIRLGYLLDACPSNIQTVLDMHDVMSERMMSLASAGLKANIQMPMALEKKILGEFDRVLTISRSDQMHVKHAMGLNNALYVPCAIEEAPIQAAARRSGLTDLLPWGLLARFRSGSRSGPGATLEPSITKDPSGRRLLFLGANSVVNVEGLKWFLDQVWPLLLPSGFQLDVVGDVGTSFPEVPEGVNVHGRQEDLSGFFNHANIAINPVFVGGGLKIKCIDALAAGLPCVTTFEGAAGLSMARYAGLWVAESRTEFAKQIVLLANNPHQRDRIARLGPLFIAGEFSQAKAHTRLESWIQSIPTPDQD